MSFTVTTEPRENRQLAVTIEVSHDRVDQELRKAAAKLASQYRIPGFRKGKAPYHIVVQQIGLPNLYSEFIDELGQELFREAIDLDRRSKSGLAGELPRTLEAFAMGMSTMLAVGNSRR